MFFRRNQHDEYARALRERIDLLEKWVEDLQERERVVATSLHSARLEAREAAKRADIAQNNFEWARVRLNQVEQERATLIASMLKAPIGALEIERRLTPEQGNGMPHVPDGLFEDIGDDAAAALGIEHDEDGKAVTHG